MALLLAEDVDKAFADRVVLRGATLSVDAGEHVGLVGANGSGKSTLLAILAGELQADRGRFVRPERVVRLVQDPTLTGKTVDEEMRLAVAWHKDLLARYESAMAAGDLEAASKAQSELDSRGWEIDHKIDAVLDKLSAPPRSSSTATLSGGERRRVALASVLLQDPDLLLLDEPTNHLDSDATEWLQGWLSTFRGAVLLVTHDRYLLEAVADRIVEVDGGQTVSYEGSYADYLVERAERQSRLMQQRERMLAAVAREAAWASRSPAARTTKQKARLQRLDVLRDSVPEIRDPSLSFAFSTGVPRGITLVELHAVRKSYGPRVLFSSLDLVVRPGERVGILGPNGTGKSTLLKVILGEVTPDSGSVLRGPKTKLGVLDQERSGLDADETVFEAAGGGNDHLVVGGEPVHVAGFLQRFAFRRESFDQRVSACSGGEKARLLLAKLMLRGANLLLLDEPTNDLDLLTLRVLEEALLGFDGGLLVVSHDRAFVDRVCTNVIAFEGDGRVTPYASRTQWVEQRARAAAAAEKQAAKPAERPAAAAVKPTKTSNKLSFREQRELEAIPDKIDALESEQKQLEALLSDPETYKRRSAELPALSERLSALETEIAAAYQRWEELSART